MTHRYAIGLAALLHDIGVFYQHADSGVADKPEYLSEEILKRHAATDSAGERRPLHHSLWTAQFLHEHQTVWSSFHAATFTPEYSLSELCNVYKAPVCPADKLMHRAIQFALGRDTSPASMPGDATPQGRLSTIFDALARSSGTRVTPLVPLSVSPALFPETVQQGNNSEAYKKLWLAFVEEFRLLDATDKDVFLHNLLSLLEKYAWCVPCGAAHLPDVSLYDHLRSTAAFALALYDYDAPNTATFMAAGPVAINEAPEPLLFVGCDLSGIQKYLYDIVPRRAAKNLKGRSFYLQLLLDTVNQYVRDRLNLPGFSVIYSSGGGFYMIMANTESVRAGLDALHQQLERLLWQYHGTGLYLAMAYEPFGSDVIFEQHFGLLWSKLSEKLSRQKNQRYTALLQTEYDLFFTDTGERGGVNLRDAIDGEDLGIVDETAEVRKALQHGHIIKLDETSAEGLYVKPYTKQIIELGEHLRDAKYRVVSTKPVPETAQEPFCPLGLPYFNYLLPEQSFNNLQAKADQHGLLCHISVINQTMVGKTSHWRKNRISWMWYGGNEYPLDERGLIKTFEELCGVRYADAAKQITAEKPKFTRLGVLRMDVDNLGSLFKEGFAKGRQTFSSYASLSRQLDFFFRGFINNIWSETHAESKKGFKKYTQIIYAGGDDLFIVGKWDVLIELAGAIHRSFADFTCNHTERLSLSGGLIMVDAKEPLLRAAEQSAEAEDSSKNYRLKGIGKNAFTMLDITLNWDEEFEALSSLKNEIYQSLKEEVIQSGLLSKIIAYYMQAGFEQHQIKRLQVIWQMVYDFTRTKSRYRNQVVLHQFLDAWNRAIIEKRAPGFKNTNYHPLELLAHACRWVALEKRTNEHIKLNKQFTYA